MKKRLSVALAAAALSLGVAAAAAGAAPASPLASLSAPAEAVAGGGQLEQIGYRRWHHRKHHWGWQPRRCHVERVCWRDRWGYKHCDWIRRCRPRGPWW